jgi:hypothetical protein
MYNAWLFTVVSPGVPLFMGVDQYESKCLLFTLFYCHVVALIRDWKGAVGKTRRIFHSPDQNRPTCSSVDSQSAQSWNILSPIKQIGPTIDLFNLPGPFLAKRCFKIKFQHIYRAYCWHSKPIPIADDTRIIMSHPEIDHYQNCRNDGLAVLNIWSTLNYDKTSVI